MNLRNKDIYTGVQQIVKFADRDIPVKISYAVGKSLVRLREQFDLIEACRSKMVKSHQVMNGDGQPLKNKDGSLKFDDEAAVGKELDELQAEECEVDVHSMDIDKFMELMEKKKCKECSQPVEDVSSNEMAALIKLGILT